MSKPTPPEDFYSLRQAADYAHVKRQAIFIAIRNGKIKAEKINGQWYITRANLDAYRANKYNRELRRIDGELIYDLEKGNFSIQQVCKVLSATLGRPYSLQHLYYLLRSGQLKGSRIGAAWIIAKEDAIALLEKERGDNKQQQSFA